MEPATLDRAAVGKIRVLPKSRPIRTIDGQASVSLVSRGVKNLAVLCGWRPNEKG